MSDLERVRIGHFIDNGYPVRGVIHVGANDGYEISWYLKLGIENIIAIEPLPKAFKLLKQYNIPSYNIGFGNEDIEGILQVTHEAGMGSTFLECIYGGPEDFEDKIICPIMKLSTFVKKYNIKIENYNCLVVDVEGMELDVLKGCEQYLDNFDLLNIECRTYQLYKNSALADEVIDFLLCKGFKVIYPQEDLEKNFLDDILFVK